jgi:hypothetical protein
MKQLLTLTLTLLLFSCTKSFDVYEREPEGKERFAFTGLITNCHTGAPLKDARINITLKHLNNSGFFMWTEDGGSTYTDENGYYSIHPLRFSGTTDIEINISKDGYFAAINHIDMDSIIENGGDLFLFNQGMTEPGVVRLILNNTTPHDSTDKIYAQVTSSQRCDNTAYGHVTETFTGNISNKQLDYEVNGNDSVNIKYTVRKNGTTTRSEITRFCPAKTTTTIVIDY